MCIFSFVQVFANALLFLVCMYFQRLYMVLQHLFLTFLTQLLCRSVLYAVCGLKRLRILHDSTLSSTEFSRILLAMGIPPPHPTPAIPTATTLPPQPPWASLLTHVSSWTQVRILLGTFTQTWDFWTGGQAHTSLDELCQMALHRSSNPCQHLALPLCKFC